MLPPRPRTAGRGPSPKAACSNVPVKRAGIRGDFFSSLTQVYMVALSGDSLGVLPEYPCAAFGSSHVSCQDFVQKLLTAFLVAVSIRSEQTVNDTNNVGNHDENPNNLL